MAFDDFVWFENERAAKRLIEQDGFPAYLQSLSLWGTPIAAMRRGDTGVGYTFEQLLGVQENNAKTADLHGYEVKTTASDQAQITLFTKNPSVPKRAVHALVDRYGSLSHKGKKLNTNLIVGRKTAFADTYLTINYNDQGELEVVSGDQGVVAKWSREDIQSSTAKLLNLMLCPARRCSADGIKHFTYTTYQIFTGFDYDAFTRCIETGRISIHFRIEGSLAKARNRGAAFRTRLQDVKLFYASATTWP